MYQFWKNNKNVLMVAVGMFVASITTLIILLNNENLNGEMKANVVHGEVNHAHQEETLDYESLAPETSGPAVIVGLDGLIDYANEEYKKETRFIESEVKDQLFFSYIHPQDLAEILAAYGKVLSSQKPDLLVGPFRMKNAAGEYLLQMAAMQPIFQDDHMVGVAIETENISDNLFFGSSTEDYELEEMDDSLYSEGDNEVVKYEEDEEQDENKAQIDENTEDIKTESGSLDNESEYKYSNFESDYLPPGEQAEQTENVEQTAPHTNENMEEEPDEVELESETNDDKTDIEASSQSAEPSNNYDSVDEGEPDPKSDANNDNAREANDNEDQGNHYGQIKNSEKTPIEENENTNNDKNNRDNTNSDKKVVVDNLARVVNSVYRDPNFLALLI